MTEFFLRRYEYWFDRLISSALHPTDKLTQAELRFQAAKLAHADYDFIVVHEAWLEK